MSRPLRAIALTIAAFLVFLLLYLAAALFMMSRSTSIHTEHLAPPAPITRAAEAPLRVLSWNLGYAGLGAGSDFMADGGKMLRPPSRAAVRANLAAIQQTLRASEADAYLFQETARAGFLTRGIDVLGGVRAALAQSRGLFSTDIRTRLLPRPLSLQHGPASFIAVAAEPTRVRDIPDETSGILGFVKRNYHVQTTRLDVSGRPWTLINTHLAAFDDGAITRRAQIEAVLTIASAEYAEGRAVVIGGDFNMVLAETAFAHTTEPKYLFWVHPFPRDALPEGWRIAADAATPSVRTNERPFVAGENYTAVIDGFIVSPNVEALSVRTRDLGFAHTDHQPVRGEFRRTD